MKEHNFLQKKAIKHPRLAGIILLLTGAYFTYTWILEPYNKIIRQEQDVSVSIAGTVLGIFLPILGVVFLVFGNKYANEIFMSPSDLSKKQKIIFYLILAFAVISFFFLFLNWLSRHGYKLL